MLRQWVNRGLKLGMRNAFSRNITTIRSKSMIGRAGIGSQLLGASLFLKPNPIRSDLTTIIRRNKCTLNQSRKRGDFKRQRKRRLAAESKAPDLEKAPQKRAVVIRVTTMKPKKPNSSNRKICRLRTTNGRVLTAFIPGEGHNAQEHSVVYIRGGRVQDLPGVKYKCIRGKGDLHGVAGRVTSRSRYGVKKPAANKS